MTRAFKAQQENFIAKLKSSHDILLILQNLVQVS